MRSSQASQSTITSVSFSKRMVDLQVRTSIQERSTIIHQMQQFRVHFDHFQFVVGCEVELLLENGNNPHIDQCFDSNGGVEVVMEKQKRKKKKEFLRFY